MIIEINGIPVNIIKKRIKNMHLYVKPPDGHVEITAPVYVSNRNIRLFVEGKTDWIRSKQAVIRAQPHPSGPQFVSGETLPVWGKNYRLCVLCGSRGYFVRLNGDEAVLTVRKESTAKQREARVNEWYRGILKQRIGQLLPGWIRRTGLNPSSWQIKNMKTRWGSCNTRTGKIWFNLQLAKKPEECLEYIILHELAHLKVRNHGPEFTALMDRYMPDWREIRKRLNRIPD